MKLRVSRIKGQISGYTVSINKPEAEAAGLIDSDGNPIEAEKIVDVKNRRIIIQKSTDSTTTGKAISSRFIYRHLDELRAGKRKKTAKNDHYIMKGNILYKQSHQEYLRGEEPLPYAEMIGEVFYEILDK